MFSETLQQILDEVARDHRARPIPDPEWKGRISSQFAQAVKTETRRSFATAHPELCDGPEWLFDFTTVELEPGITDWCVSVAPTLVIAGEIELNPRRSFIFNDFRKLMVADATFCFFIFQADNEIAAGRMCTTLIEGARRKQHRAREQGVRTPTDYLISCFVYGTSCTFLHSDVKALASPDPAR
jgi:hypothetical protein